MAYAQEIFLYVDYFSDRTTALDFVQYEREIVATSPNINSIYIKATNPQELKDQLAAKMNSTTGEIKYFIFDSHGNTTPKGFVTSSAPKGDSHIYFENPQTSTINNTIEIFAPLKGRFAPFASVYFTGCNIFKGKDFSVFRKKDAIQRAAIIKDMFNIEQLAYFYGAKTDNYTARVIKNFKTSTSDYLMLGTAASSSVLVIGAGIYSFYARDSVIYVTSALSFIILASEILPRVLKRRGIAIKMANGYKIKIDQNNAKARKLRIAQINKDFPKIKEDQALVGESCSAAMK